MSVATATATVPPPGTSTLQPFAAGDVFVGATLLDHPDDDHAGRGRIFQFDANLKPKGLLWTADTTHLVYGLGFAPDGTLWAHDPWAWVSIRVAPDGRQLESLAYHQRAFSKVHFLPDGNLLFTEALAGENQPLPLTTRHPPLPGHRKRLGDGFLYVFTPEGELMAVYEPEYHGGVTGSMAITHSALSADGSTLFYVSETGPRLMRFCLKDGRQLPDLRYGQDADRTMTHFDLSRRPDGTLLVCMGNRLDALSPDGVWLRNWRLPGFGWAVLDATRGDLAYIANWFSGEVIKLDLESGAVLASTVIAPKCIAGVAVCGGNT
jgi:hypothetical protein